MNAWIELWMNATEENPETVYRSGPLTDSALVEWRKAASEFMEHRNKLAFARALYEGAGMVKCADTEAKS